MLPCVAWPPLAASGSQQTTQPSRCSGNAKHANQSCPNGKHTVKSEEPSKPAPADSLSSASSRASDMLPFRQPATLQSHKNSASSICDDHHSKSTYQLHPPPTAMPLASRESSDFKRPTTSPVHDNTENTAQCSPDSMFSTTQWVCSEPAKGGEPCKSDNPSTHSTDRLPYDLPATASIAAKSPVAIHPVAAGADEHIDNPFAIFPDCAITTCTTGAPLVPRAHPTITAATEHKGHPVAASEDTCWPDYLDTSLSSDPIQSILQLLPNDLPMMIHARLADGNSSR